MKKILSVIALAAVIAGMASCNKEDDMKLERFKITVDDITPLSAHIVITPPDEQMLYTYTLLNKGTFDWFKAQEGGLKAALGIFAGEQGTDDYVYELLPNTKYAMCVGEKDPNESRTILGEVEYVRFQTQSMQPQSPDFVEAGLESLPMTGECYFYTEANNLVCMSCQYPIPDSDGKKMNLFLIFASDKLTGHFTTDNLFSYLFWQSGMEVVDSEDEQQEGFTACGADIKGTYDQTTGKYEYKGWCDLLTEDKELFRVPVTLQCTAKGMPKEQKHLIHWFTEN